MKKSLLAFVLVLILASASFAAYQVAAYDQSGKDIVVIVNSETGNFEVYNISQDSTEVCRVNREKKKFQFEKVKKISEMDEE